MKIFLLTLLTVNLLSLCIFAQNNKKQTFSDFSGTWILDKDNSIFSYRDGRRQNDLSDNENYESYTLIISQKESEIKILQNFLFRGKQLDYRITLFTDERGEENICPHKQYDFRENSKETFWLEDVNIKSKTTWKKNKIIRRGNYKAKLGVWNHILDQTYEISNEGKTLTVISDLQIMIGNPMFSNQKSKLIFQKEN